MRVSIFRLLKHTSMILDVFSFFDWAKDPKSSLSIPFVPNAIVGMAIECMVQDIEEGISAAIENRLQAAKIEGIDAVRRFVNSWKPNSGIEFKLLKYLLKQHRIYYMANSKLYMKWNYGNIMKLMV